MVFPIGILQSFCQNSWIRLLRLTSLKEALLQRFVTSIGKIEKAGQTCRFGINESFCNFAKVAFTQHYTWQNFGSRVLRLVNNCLESICKMQYSGTLKYYSPSVTHGKILVHEHCVYAVIHKTQYS